MADIIATMTSAGEVDDDQASLTTALKAMTDEMVRMRETYNRMTNVLDKVNKLEREMTEVRGLKMERDEMRVEMVELRKELKEERETMKEERKALQTELRQQAETMKLQQAFMERLDQKERACNVIVTGLEEGGNDEERVKDIIATVEPTVVIEIKSFKRLGQQDAEKVRPLLVTLASNEIRNNLVEKARVHRGLGQMRMKKDSHPAVRAEWRRLFEVMEKEKAKAENVGHNIRVDIKKRQVLLNEQVIDSWKTNIFGKSHF